MSKRVDKHDVGTRAGERGAHRWQTIIVAAIGGVAAVLAAVLPIVLSGSAGPRPPNPPSPPDTGGTPSIAISAMTQQARDDGSRDYRFSGTSTGVDPSSMLVFVMAQNPALTAAGGDWLVSPAATVAADGRWQVSWDVSRLPARVKWVAVVYLNSQGACAPGEQCAEPSPCGFGDCGPPSDSASSPGDLRKEGPDAANDLAHATFVASTASG